MSSNNDKHTHPSRAYIYAIGLVFLTLAAYGRVWSFEFLHWDDPDYVTENTMVLHGLSIEGIRWAMTTGHFASWSPLTWISHMADTTFFGPGPKGPHATNLFLHVANSLLLFFVLRRMTGFEGRSAFVAALFALHPLHVESVAWVAERKDVLSTFFGLLALVAYTFYSEKRTLTRYILVVLFFAMSLMSKAMWLTLPLLLVLLDYWPYGRFSLIPGKRDANETNTQIKWAVIDKLPLVALTIASAVITINVQSESGAVASTETSPLIFRVANAIDAYFQYIVMFVFPRGLAAFYPHPGTTISWTGVAIAATALTAITIALLRAWKSRPYAIVGWFWYLGTLVPVIGIVQVGSQAYADRYTYLPTIGLSIAMVWLACEIARKWKVTPQALAVAGVLISVVAASLTWKQSGYWKDDESLWRRALAVTENNYRAHSNLGHALARTDDPDDAQEAIEHFVKSAELNPSNPKTYVGLGDALATVGRNDEAFSAYRKVIEIDENHAAAYVNLGKLLVDVRRPAEAVVQLERAVALDPINAEAHNNLGSVYGMRGDFDLAIRHFQEAIRLRPGYESAETNLALTLKHKANPR